MHSQTLSLIDALKESARRDDAWPMFMARYHDTVRQWCRRRGLGEADADDLTVKIFEKLQRDLPAGKFDPDRGRFRTYLGMVVRSAVSHFFEQQANRPGDRGVGGTTNMRAVHHVTDPAYEELGESLEASLHADIMVAFERVLARVTPDNQAAVQRVLLNGEKPVDVARDLGRSPTSLFQLVARTRDSIRAEYQKMFDGKAT